jgi:hypothetical protein
MRPLNPIFHVFLFFNATVFLPVVINGVRVLLLWYSPLTYTGQVTFEVPFLEFVISYLSASIALGLLLRRIGASRFVLVRGPMRVRSVIRATLRDRVGRLIVLAYFPSYFLSFMVVSGLLLLPNFNVSPYFAPLTLITYQASGVGVLWEHLVLNPVLYALGALNALALTLSLILSYYLVSLIYVSVNTLRFPVPSSFRLSAYNSVSGFLTSSVPSLGTIAGVCCLTPTAVNSLLYLISGAHPALTKGLTWKYGTFVAGAWTGGILQALQLSSPTLLGLIMVCIGVWQVRLISSKIAMGTMRIERY